MALDNFVPVVWSAKILENLLKAHIFAPLCNRDYEGEIRDFGDAVKINTTGRVTISNYTRNADLPAIESLTGGQEMLVVDQAKVFNFAIDDVDAAQQKPKVMGAFTRQAAWEMADVIDSFVALALRDSTAGNGTTATGNRIADATVGIGSSDSNLYNILVNLGVILDENNIPGEGRWVVLPPWCKGLLQKDDRFVRYGTPPQTAVLTRGFVQEAANLNIYISNNIVQSDASHWDIQCGFSDAVTFAEQVVKTEAYRPQQRFSDALKGLCVYGIKVTRPQGLSMVRVAKGTLA